MNVLWYDMNNPLFIDKQTRKKIILFSHVRIVNIPLRSQTNTWNKTRVNRFNNNVIHAYLWLIIYIILSSSSTYLKYRCCCLAATGSYIAEVCSLYYVLFFKYNKKEQPWSLSHTHTNNLYWGRVDKIDFEGEKCLQEGFHTNCWWYHLLNGTNIK